METGKNAAPSLDECIRASGGTKALVVKEVALGEIPRLLESEGGSRSAFIVADENTMHAAGDEVERVLAQAKIKIEGKRVFPGSPWLHAEYCHVEALKTEIAGTRDASSQEQVPIPIAVGAGTVNDIVKQAADELSVPCICVPTAASVDGYTSFGSALIKDGFKQTLSCAAPRWVVADLGVLSRAPQWLASSGFGDLAGKIPAGADWIISDAGANFGAKGADRIDEKAWGMVQYGLRDFLNRSVDAAHGNKNAVAALFEALAITGFAMQYAKNSRPVSGAEHLFAHIWEMEDLSHDGVPVTHGHKVAMGTLAVTAFIEALFSSADPPLPPRSHQHPSRAQRMAEVRAAFVGSPALESVLAAADEKFDEKDENARVAEGFQDTWKDLRGKVLEQIMPYAHLKEMLATAGCPVLPAQTSLTRAGLIACTRRAQMIRCRYSSLDLAWDLGCFDATLAKMESSAVYFY